MAAWRRAIELSLGDEDTTKLRSIAQWRMEPAGRGGPNCIIRRCGASLSRPWPKLDDRPRPDKQPTITFEAKTWQGRVAEGSHTPPPSQNRT